MSKLRLTAGRTAHRYLRMSWMIPAFWATPSHGSTGKLILRGTFLTGGSISVGCIPNAWFCSLQWPDPQYISLLLGSKAWLSIDTQQTRWSAFTYWSHPSLYLCIYIYMILHTTQKPWFNREFSHTWNHRMELFFILWWWDSCVFKRDRVTLPFTH